MFMCTSRSLSQGSANAAVLDVTQTGGHKKRVRRSSFLNAKKLYEDAQMARKVKQYLSNLSLETNEESLQTLSLQCEPSISTCEFVAVFLLSFSFWGLGNLIGKMWSYKRSKLERNSPETCSYPHTYFTAQNQILKDSLAWNKNLSYLANFLIVDAKPPLSLHWGVVVRETLSRAAQFWSIQKS